MHTQQGEPEVKIKTGQKIQVHVTYNPGRLCQPEFVFEMTAIASSKHNKRIDEIPAHWSVETEAGEAVLSKDWQGNKKWTDTWASRPQFVELCKIETQKRLERGEITEEQVVF